MSRIITLTTDFGIEDEYVGVMKGVILSRAPDSCIIDITHAITPGNILEGQFYLMSSWKFFPSGTVHIAVVDPGVGSGRKALIILNRGHYFVGPDNGIFTFAIKDATGIWEINLNSKVILQPTSTTFHGRDIFAPVAAHIAAGRDINEVGAKHRGTPVELPFPEAQKGSDSITGEILFFDRFGNALTTIPWSDRIKRVDIPQRKLSLPVVRFYSEVKTGEPVALPGSRNLVEISVNRGNARKQLGLTRGLKVIAFLQ